MKRLKKVYLAISYTGMKESSYRQANKAAAMLMNKGMNVFSPISHCHIIAKENKLPTTWDFWMAIDYQFIDWCEELLVLIPEEGIERLYNSPGVCAEIEYARKNSKLVKFIEIRDGELFYKFINWK